MKKTSITLIMLSILVTLIGCVAVHFEYADEVWFSAAILLFIAGVAALNKNHPFLSIFNSLLTALTIMIYFFTRMIIFPIAFVVIIVVETICYIINKRLKKVNNPLNNPELF